jgi:hypothetical protein
LEKRLTYEDFEKIGTITRLPEVEKEDYMKRHEIFLERGLRSRRKTDRNFLAKKFNIKISGAFVHIATIETLKKFVKEEIAEKMNKAFEEVSILPEFLEFAREKIKISILFKKL